VRWLAALALCLCVVVPATARADWGVTRSGFDAGVVRRYKAILERDPHDAAALRALVTLYRRYKNVAALTAEYEAEGDTWSSLCVRAHLPGVSREASVALLQRALRVKPDDGRGWIALGETTQDSKIARDAFRAALPHVNRAKERTRALEGLLGAARALHDAATIDAAYAELIELRPRDGRLWLDRGDAQLAAGKTADAVASLGEAAARLRGDPEKRLAAMTAIGVALERQGNVDAAVAQWEATLDAIPRGYYLSGEIVAHIVAPDAHRGRAPEMAGVRL